MGKLGIYHLIGGIFRIVETILSKCGRKPAPAPSRQLPEWEVLPYRFCDINYYGSDSPVGSGPLPNQVRVSSSLSSFPRARILCRAESLGSSQPLCPSALEHGCEAARKGVVR